MSHNFSGITISVPHHEERSESAGRVLAAVLLFCGLGSGIFSIFHFSETGANPYILLAAGCVYCVIGSAAVSAKHWYVYLIAILLPAVFIIFAGNQIINGWNISVNQIFSVMETWTGRIFPRFETDDSLNWGICADCFLILPTILLAFICGRASRVKRAWLFAAAAIAAAIWFAALAFQTWIPVVSAAVFLAAAIFLWGQSRKSSLSLFVPIVIFILISLIPALIAGNGNESDAASFRRSTARAFHSLRYHSEGVSLPEGDFTSLTNFNQSEDVVLEVKTDRTDDLYLRGFVGEEYIGSGWTELAASKRAEYATLFSWLHGTDFYGQNQYFSALSALNLDHDSSEIQITNINACRSYIYAPYETFDNVRDENRIGDENLIAQGLQGETEYTVYAAEKSVAESDSVYRALVDAHSQDDPQVNEYLTEENAYRDFVYDNYLDCPEEARSTIEEILSGWNIPEGKIDFSDAENIVRTCLNAYYYSEDPGDSYQGGDFLTHFLKEDAVGNSVHFATAATLIFRYLGIPARYVEGYYISSEELTNAQGAEVQVTGKNACAWAEIYRDGVGFVPFEMDLSQLAYSESDVQDLTEEEEQPEDQTQDNSVFDYLIWIVKIIAVLALIILLCFLFLAVRRSLKRRKIMKYLNSSDNSAAVGYTVTYLLRVLALAGIPYRNGSLYNLKEKVAEVFGEETADDFCSAVATQQKALFSVDPISPEERASVTKLLNEITEKLIKKSKTADRWRLIWIECI